MAITSKISEEFVITETPIITKTIQEENKVSIDERDVKLVDDSLTGDIDTNDKATIQVLQSQIDSLKIKVSDLQNENASINIKLNTALSENIKLKNQLSVFTSNNFSIDSELQKTLIKNNELKLQVKKLIDTNNQLTNQLLLYKSPYGHELEILSNINNLYTNQLLQILTLNKLITDLDLDKNLDLLISNIQFYIIDKIINSISTNFTTLQEKIDHQNQIENSKFTINEQILNQINIDNINIYLINGKEVKQLTTKNITIDDNGISFLQISENDLNIKGDYLLYFTNSNYIFKDKEVRQYSMSNSLDIVLFRDIENTSTKGQKIRFKDFSNKIIQESIIYDDIQFGQWKVLIVDKIRNSYKNCDIVTYEIDDFYMNLKLTNTDIDIIQQLLIGKMIYNKQESTRTFFDVDDETILIILRTYLDPNLNTETRIETLT